MEGGGRGGYAHGVAMAALNLSPDEQLIFQGHPSWRAILGFYLKGILVAALIGVIAKLLRAGTRTVVPIVSGAPGLTVLIAFGNGTATRYTIPHPRLQLNP